MSFFAWFRRRRGVAQDVTHPCPSASPDPAMRPQEWSANQIPALLLVARRLVKAPQVRALEEAFRKSDGQSLRRELGILLDKASQAFGPGHIDTATVLEQLGRCGRDPAETAKHLEPCLAIRTRALGPSHPDTVRAQHFLGFCYLRTDNASFTFFRQRIVELPAPGTDNAS